METTYTIEGKSERACIQEATEKAREEGIEPLRVSVLSSEPLFRFAEYHPHVRCIVLVRGPKEEA